MLIDGRDVRSLRLPELRRQIGIVPQDCVLMKGSVAFNIAYGLAEDGPDLLKDEALMRRVREAT